MSSVALYCIPMTDGDYCISRVDTNQNQIYERLRLAILRKDFNEFFRQLKSVQITYELLNQLIFMWDSKSGSYLALNLCHFAVVKDCKGILEELLKCGGDLSAKIIEVTISQNQRSFVEKDSLIDLIVRHFNKPIKYFQDLFDGYIETTDIGHTSEFKFDFTILCPTASMQDHALQNERQMCVLNEIVNSSIDLYSEECTLLQHPLIEAYLTCKWIHYRRFFYILVVMHVVFVACLSAIALLIVGNFNIISKISNAHAQLDQSENDAIDVVSTSMKIVSCLLLPMSILLFFQAIIQMCFIPLRKFFYEFEIISNLLTSTFAVAYSIYVLVFSLQRQIENNLQLMYTVTGLFILPAWINLMLIIGRIPNFGCYSLMFTTVMKNFLKAMASFIFLIIGFALSFSLMFPMSESFRNPFGAIVQTIVMMIGEFDYKDNFSKNVLIDGGWSKCIFISFVISCSIILMNLTQGIAVNDIKLLHEISQIIRLEKETRFLYEFERVFTHPMLTSNPVFRKIKKRFYDSGAVKTEITITKENKQNISNTLLAKLVQLYKPTKSRWNPKLSHPRFNFGYIPKGDGEEI